LKETQGPMGDGDGESSSESDMGFVGDKKTGEGRGGFGDGPQGKRGSRA